MSAKSKNSRAAAPSGSTNTLARKFATAANALKNTAIKSKMVLNAVTNRFPTKASATAIVPVMIPVADRLDLFGGLKDMFGAAGYDSKAYDELLGDTNSIAGDVSSINKSVNMADEDLKNLVDMAERQYVNQINLTAQTPVVTINGANTGNTEEDRRKLGDTIRDIILEQAAAGSYRSTARAYSGG